ncbi:protein translocase subunit SecF [Georgenia sp. 10Sc9-8]|uniref:Protein-export membrane protein SecF n=1 Tax=Georgenia halotolerans TaxID=3028317 RepID=A0ABT5TZ05_9MICO|nr:protein translocase subunit SecF [Georgenia halotolerans]
MPSMATLGNELYTGDRSLPIVPRRRTWFTVALALVAASLLILVVRDLNIGIEFRGGSQFTVSGATTLEQQPAHEVLDEVGADQAARVSTVGAEAVRVQTEELSAEQTTEVRDGLAEAYGVAPTEVTSTFIGPTWGESITQQAIQGLVVFLLLVALVLAAYFRTWKMAAAALLGLLHDMVVSVGIYALVGFEITPATVIGFLTILGYSLYDTVVVFDKVRENTTGLYDQDEQTYAESANLAVNQTVIRSVNTTITSVLPVASILFVGALLLGAGTLRDIALALFIGMIVSTVSSIFVSTPLLVQLRQREQAITAHDEVVTARRNGEPLPAAHDGTARAQRDTARTQDEDEAESNVVAGSHQGTRAQPRRRKKAR